VVDDDRMMREALQELLQQHGHAAEAYASGEAFLTADRPEREGCLVVDALMPGMGGIALLERLKAKHHGLPAIMITGMPESALSAFSSFSTAGDAFRSSSSSWTAGCTSLQRLGRERLCSDLK
jgi:two-component system CheB/CheR fusion protein